MFIYIKKVNSRISEKNINQKAFFFFGNVGVEKKRDLIIQLLFNFLNFIKENKLSIDFQEIEMLTSMLWLNKIFYFL